MRIESGVVAVNRGVLGDPAAPFGNQSRADSPERAAQWNSLFSKRSTLPWMSSTKLDVARAGAVEFFPTNVEKWNCDRTVCAVPSGISQKLNTPKSPTH